MLSRSNPDKIVKSRQSSASFNNHEEHEAEYMKYSSIPSCSSW